MRQDRYSRQELFSGIGKEGQEKIRKASVFIIGCGALGSLQAESLTRAGVGRLTIIDRDFVEPSNLQRQALFQEEDAAAMLPKAVASAQRLKKINSEVEVVPVVADLSNDNVSLIQKADLLMDGTDNFQTRYLLNDLAWKFSIPWIYGACVSATGISMAFVPPAFPCLRCIFETEPAPGTAPTCDTIGIIWPTVAAVVSYQVTAALKILTGKELKPEIFQCDVWESRYHLLSMEKAKRPDCLTCGRGEYPALQQRRDFQQTLCGRNAVQIRPSGTSSLNLDQIEHRWQKVGNVKRNPFLIRLALEKNEIVLFPDGRAIIKGTTDLTRARILYSQYIGE